MEDKLAFEIEADEIEIFLQDVNEHLQEMESGILRLEGEGDPDTLNAVFRAAHTIKAIAATVGHQRMADLTHTLETLFDHMRGGELTPTQAVTDVLLAALDGLKGLRDEVVNLEPSGVDADTLLNRLRALMQTTQPTSQSPAKEKVKRGDAKPVDLSDSTVRISVERLDTLMNLVGELVTDRTRLTQIEGLLHAQRGKGGIHHGNGAVGALSEMTIHFGRVVDQLQQEVMQARMLPIAHLFDKFPRLVRDVARAAGKQVELVIEGEATELDRSVIEVIGDPLIHLLRNAVDHGIELPEEREAASKPPTGTVWLTAAHEEGHVVITVRDDGRGIDPVQLRRAAVRRGLLSEEEAAKLDDDAVVSLIFDPTFSTSERVTDVSGRGVGLDVVRTNIKRLSGSVVVESEVGRGTTFRLTLPLTLAIVEAMLVALGGDVYAIPMASIVESLYMSDVTVNGVKGRPVIQWRNSVLPLLSLRKFFAHPRLTALADDDKQAVVTVAWGKQQIGLIVDRLIGKQEIVLKSLGAFIGSTPGISGCTTLGDGSIALIVDVPGLISAVMQAQREGGLA